MNLHPYDDRELVFKNSDENRVEGLKVVEHLLGFLPSDQNPSYDLMFYSGGIGVIDKLSICFRDHDTDWNHLSKKHDIVQATDLEAKYEIYEDLLWLIDYIEELGNPQELAVNFVNENKREFQTPCKTASSIYFVRYSDVNDWTIFWKNDGKINYLGYSQG